MESLPKETIEKISREIIKQDLTILEQVMSCKLLTI